LKPLDISQEEKFRRMDDPTNDSTWNYELVYASEALELT
jgi:hypothetical protein